MVAMVLALYSLHSDDSDQISFFITVNLCNCEKTEKRFFFLLVCILSYNCVLHYELLAGSGGVLSFFVEERRGEKEKQLSYDERQDIFFVLCVLSLLLCCKK